MNLTERDKRALMLLGVALLIIVIWRVTSTDDPVAVAPSTLDSVPAAEARLGRLRLISATIAGKEEALNRVKAELVEREKGLIQADTGAQAQAQLLELIQRLGKAQVPEIVIRSNEIGQARRIGSDYGEVAVSVSFEAGIDQLVNFLADLTKQASVVATSELHIGAANPKAKTMPVRVTVTGLVRSQLVPEKKAVATF